MADRLFPPVVGWTIFTGIFAWLPLVRIIGRAEGYTWSILGLSGAGTEGPFLVFLPLTGYVVVMIYALHRGPRTLAHVMSVLWHLAVTGLVIAGVVLGGTDATWQGQGLHFSIPMWLLVVPFLGFTGVAIAWAVLDRRAESRNTPVPWSRRNTTRLVASLVLLAAALVLFRAGTNYNWVTAVAIVTTIAHWILLAESFAPKLAPTARSR
jgi:hypothetical protein